MAHGKQKCLAFSCCLFCQFDSAISLLVLLTLGFTTVRHFFWWWWGNIQIPFGLEKLLKGFFENLFLDYSLLTQTFPSVVMVTFILQELKVNLEL